MTKQLSAVFLLLVSSHLVQADGNLLKHLYVSALDSETQPVQESLLAHARRAEIDQALRLSDKLLADTKELQKTRPALYGKILINHGILLSASSNYAPGLSRIAQGLKFLESEYHPFSKALIKGIMAKALSEMALEALADAEDSFRRAQHIVHRQEGVHSEEQLSMINYLTRTNLRLGNLDDADRQQMFHLLIAEKTWGSDSVQLLPSLGQVGAYFAYRGNSLPLVFPREFQTERDSFFRRSINLRQRAIDIVEQHYGKEDLRLVPLLKALAKTHLWHINTRGQARYPLQRSVEIINTSPNQDLADRARALVDLGDLYIITSDRQAGATYLRAWSSLQESETTRKLADELFSLPVRLMPEYMPTLLLKRLPDGVEAENELFIDFEYTITTEGRVKQVKVLDRNVSNEQVRLMREKIKRARYRPGIEMGKIVQTDGFRFRQRFAVSDRL